MSSLLFSLLLPLFFLLSLSLSLSLSPSPFVSSQWGYPYGYPWASPVAVMANAGEQAQQQTQMLQNDVTLQGQRNYLATARDANAAAVEQQQRFDYQMLRENKQIRRHMRRQRYHTALAQRHAAYAGQQTMRLQQQQAEGAALNQREMARSAGIINQQRARTSAAAAAANNAARDAAVADRNTADLLGQAQMASQGLQQQQAALDALPPELRARANALYQQNLLQNGQAPLLNADNSANAALSSAVSLRQAQQYGNLANFHLQQELRRQHGAQALMGAVGQAVGPPPATSGAAPSGGDDSSDSASDGSAGDNSAANGNSAAASIASADGEDAEFDEAELDEADLDDAAFVDRVRGMERRRGGRGRGRGRRQASAGVANPADSSLPAALKAATKRAHSEGREMTTQDLPEAQLAELIKSVAPTVAGPDGPDAVTAVGAEEPSAALSRRFKRHRNPAEGEVDSVILGSEAYGSLYGSSDPDWASRSLSLNELLDPSSASALRLPGSSLDNRHMGRVEDSSLLSDAQKARIEDCKMSKMMGGGSLTEAEWRRADRECAERMRNEGEIDQAEEGEGEGQVDEAEELEGEAEFASAKGGRKGGRGGRGGRGGKKKGKKRGGDEAEFDMAEMDLGELKALQSSPSSSSSLSSSSPSSSSAPSSSYLSSTTLGLLIAGCSVVGVVSLFFVFYFVRSYRMGKRDRSELEASRKAAQQGSLPLPYAFKEKLLGNHQPLRVM